MTLTPWTCSSCSLHVTFGGRLVKVAASPSAYHAGLTSQDAASAEPSIWRWRHCSLQIPVVPSCSLGLSYWYPVGLFRHYWIPGRKL